MVSIPLNPSQMKHGAGATIEAAHDQAALMALHSLADLGMEAVADGKKDSNTNMNAGDGYVCGIKCEIYVSFCIKFKISITNYTTESI